MFLISGPDLVVEACRSGVIGTFPALNQRISEGYEALLSEIEARLASVEAFAPFGVNLIVHKTNARLEEDLAITVRRRVPPVITSLGADRNVVERIHAYGGLVFHDVIHLHHARKAAEAGVDGLIAVSTCESMAPAVFKEMILQSTAKDIVYTPAISGVNANFLRASIVAAGGDPDNLPPHGGLSMSGDGEARAWKTFGQPGTAWATSTTFPPPRICAPG